MGGFRAKRGHNWAILSLKWPKLGFDGLRRPKPLQGKGTPLPNKGYPRGTQGLDGSRVGARCIKTILRVT